MKSNKQGNYTGRIATVRTTEGFAFISIQSVAKQDGSEHDLETAADVFLHQDEFSGELEVGKTVSFEAVPDQTRGKGHYRAMGAVAFVEVDLLPADEPPMQGFDPLVPFGTGQTSSSLVVMPTQIQRSLLKKTFDPKAVQKALENQPAPKVPRDSSIPENLDLFLQAFLRFLFPTMEHFGTHFRLDVDETELHKKLDQAREDHAALNMQEQFTTLEKEVAAFLSFRKALAFMQAEKLIRRDAIIPMENLPDFFTAVPVWFFWAEPGSPGWMSKNEDPEVHPSAHYFCNLFPNQNWADMYQLFNRRTRNLSHYRGDVIPPHVSRRIREAVSLFDYVVIMTPYHDVAGQDWENTEWVRSIDPYVVGFKKGIPFFFILARFSDSGTFPLFTEMVADTMAFLKQNGTKLYGFNAAHNPFWHNNAERFVNRSHLFDRIASLKGFSHSNKGLGDYLISVVAEALKAFEAGQLFDWMRGTPLQPKELEE